MTSRTLYDKLWDDHVVRAEDDGSATLYIDRHLIHEVTSPQAFEGLRLAGRKAWRAGSVVATADHSTPTTGWEQGYEGIRDPISHQQVMTLDTNIRVRHEVACVIVSPAQKVGGETGRSVGRSLPVHASPATAGCEATGTKRRACGPRRAS